MIITRLVARHAHGNILPRGLASLQHTRTATATATASRTSSFTFGPRVTPHGNRLFSTRPAQRQQEQQEEQEYDDVVVEMVPRDLIVEIDSMDTLMSQLGPNAPAIIMDVYADWCMPCKQLAPILEKLVLEFRGRFKLLKVDAEKVPDVAQQFPVESYPTLFAIVAGKQVAAVDQGLRTEDLYRSWIKKVIALHDNVRNEEIKLARQQQQDGQEGEQQEEDLSEVDTRGMSPIQKLELGAKLMERAQHADAAQIYNEIIRDDTAEPNHPSAYSGLVMCLLAHGQYDDCATLIETVKDKHPAALRTNPELMRAVALFELTGEYLTIEGEPLDALQVLSDAVEANPDDIDARYNFALALFMTGQQVGAISEALNVLKRKRSETRARDLLLRFFAVLGPSSELTIQGRKRLAAVMF